MRGVVEALEFLHQEVSRRDEMEKLKPAAAQLSPPRVVSMLPPPPPAVNKKLSSVVLCASTAATPDQILDEFRSASVDANAKAASSWELPASELSWREKLTEDDSAATWHGEYRGQEVQIKVFKQKLGGEEQEEFRREVSLLSQVRSPKIAYFYGAAVEPRPIVVTEYVPFNLVDVLSATETIRIDWETVFTLSRGVALSLLHLHSWVPPVLVRTLTPQNVLCDPSANFLIKISNLNLARVTQPDAQTKIRAPASVYQSPESFLSNSFTTSSDMFSYGVILWEIVNRCLSGSYSRAFSEFTDLKFDFQRVLAISKRNIRPTIAASTPKPLSSLISQCWDADPAARPKSFIHVMEQIDTLREVYLKQKNRQKQHK